MITQTKPQYYTPEEYLALEEKADCKHEYRDGKIITMTGGTTNHNKIAGNFYSYLRFALKGQKYDTYIGDVRLWISQYRLYTYPDVMVINEQPIYHGKGRTTVTNPCLIAEILSKSTQNYDQGEKFRFYRSLPTFQEYLLIPQDYVSIMHYTK
ncbi:MAG: Uma2 family endonuclease, partial [Crocosphaera sp.]